MRVRFAPSPTGYLHVGGARTALFNYLFARSNGGKFILRIEDTDRARSTDEAAAQVIESLKWLGLEWDEGPEVGGPNAPYYQAQRLPIYQKHLERLKEKKAVYPCFCSDDDLTEKKKRAEAMGLPSVYDGKCRNLSAAEIETKTKEGIPHTWRFKAENKMVSWDDLVRGLVKFDTKLVGDFVIVKSDGFPTYNFAVVVDDAEMEITHVLRGDDHISNTPRQILLYESMGFPVPVFCHISMILGPNKEKLSKRHGATSVLEFKNEGYLPDPLINQLALLGWAPADGVEVISRQKLKEVFKEARFNAAPAVFDYAKLNYLNGLAIREMPPEKAIPLLLPYVEASPFASMAKSLAPETLREMLAAVQGHCHRLADVERELRVFFLDEVQVSEELSTAWIKTELSKKLFDLAVQKLDNGNTGVIKPDEMESLKVEAKNQGIAGKNYFKPIRLALTGSEHGLELDILLKFLTRTQVVKRMRLALGS